MTTQITQQPPCLTAALAYRALGWSAIAICPPDHASMSSRHTSMCESPGKCPLGRWSDFQQRIASEDELNQFWRQCRVANVGVVMGPISGIVGIDVDGPVGEETLYSLSGGDLPTTLSFNSGREMSYRLLYSIEGLEHVPTIPVTVNGDQVLKILGKGSQTVAPPSRHCNGEVYSWRHGKGPSDLPAAPCPTWLIEMMKNHARQSQTPAQPAAKSNGGDIPLHSRNTMLTQIAGAMRRFGSTEPEILAAITESNKRCVPPLPESELKTIAHSVARYEPHQATINNLLVATQTGLAMSANRTTEAERWETPIPFEETPTPAFPLDTLPQWISEYISALSHSTQTPADLGAIPTLAIIGAALAGKFKVEARPGWVEPTNLYSVVALKSGDRKSAVITKLLAPVLDFEKAQQDRMKAIVAESETNHRMLEARLKAAETKAAKAMDSDRPELEEQCRILARQLAQTPVVAMPMLLTNDITPEKLAQVLAEQQGRLLIASAEGTIFEIALGRYNEGGVPRFENFLQAHSGDPIRVMRLGRAPDCVDNPALSLAVAVQPTVFSKLAEDPRAKDLGFLARFIYGFPRSRLGMRQIRTAAVNEATEANYRGMMLRLWQLQAAANENLEPVPHILRLTQDADDRLEAFERAIEPRLHPDTGDLEHMREWASKLAGATLRIMAILHMASEIENEVMEGQPFSRYITGQTATAAINLATSYILPHAQAAFGTMGMDPLTNLAHKALDVIYAKVSTPCQNEQNEQNTTHQSNSAHSAHSATGTGRKIVSKRDIYNPLRGTFKRVKAVEPVINLLMEHGYIREIDAQRPGPGRKPSQQYEINPIWLASRAS